MKARGSGWQCGSPDHGVTRAPARDEGAVAVTVALLVVLLVGTTALAVDLGSLFAERRKLQTAADAAALAGVQDLPVSQGTAFTRAQAYVTKNAPEADDVNVSFASGFVPNDTIVVTVTRTDSPLYFARIWGKNTSLVSATASARVTSPTAYGSGVMPFGVVATGTVSSAAGYGYGWGDYVRLKVEGGSGETGNYDLISLGGPYGTSWGLSDLRSVILAGGTQWPVWIGQTYNSSPGNKVPTGSALKEWIGADSHGFEEICPQPDPAGVVHVVTTLDGPGGCHRLILVPIVVHADDTCTDPVHPYEWPQGKSTPMKIIGFAELFVTKIGKTGNDAWIDGRFVRTVDPSTFANGPYGSSGQVHYSLVD